MKKNEKIKIIVSLLGVSAFAVVAYWAQTPASPTSLDSFQANIAGDNSVAIESEVADEDKIIALATETEDPKKTDLFKALGLDGDAEKTSDSSTTSESTTGTSRFGSLTGSSEEKVQSIDLGGSASSTTSTVEKNIKESAGKASVAESTKSQPKAETKSSPEEESKDAALPETGMPIAAYLGLSFISAAIIQKRSRK